MNLAEATHLWLLSMVMQAQMGGQVFGGWNESASEIKTCLHSLKM